MIVCLSCLQYDKDEPVPSTQSRPYLFQWEAIADSSSAALNRNFWNRGKYYNNASPSDDNFHYWPQAHALDVLVDAYTRTGQSHYRTYMDDWFVGVKIKNGNTFLNNFYDDMEWNALAMLRAHKATSDDKWLKETITVWNDIKDGWNETMGGGIAWKKDQRYYKNTPANAPACILAARLYQVSGNRDDLDWAKKIYNWQKATLINATTGLVYDGINSNNDGKLQDDAGWKFAYNQGTFIGAALELYTITKESVYLQDAIKTADNMIADRVMSPGGIMRKGDNGDGGLFNGIGVRYLTLLIQCNDLSALTRQNYIAYLRKNAETLWLKGTDRTRVVFNNDWSVMPGNTGYLNPQLSGSMLMEAMALLKIKKYI
jgi:predicted alpha-1,6-mannanase (GH76 family)